MIERVENRDWVFYTNKPEAEKLDTQKIGKWSYYPGDLELEKVDTLCRRAIDIGVCAEVKYKRYSNGVCCFYLNCDDISAHKRVISYFLENSLIRRTKTGKLHNISFKLDSQTYAREYGSDFEASIKLEDFLDLYTGKWLIKEWEK